MRFGVTITCVAFLMTALVSTGAKASSDDGSFSKYEIRKFRFRRNSAKNFERLVIEFSKKSGDSKPVVRIDAPSSGKDATIEIDQASLVGAIPEALINDSYVPRSRFLGPVSINTDGPSSGFTIRTFLKTPVGVDAFWLDHPARLVLDVFPANSPRVEGRVPEPFDRAVASYRPSNDDAANGPIVCYPISSAVSAQVMFHSQSSPAMPYASVEGLSSGAGNGPEPVICFMASSRVLPTVSYRPKSMDSGNYVQWEGGFGARQPSSEGSLFGGAGMSNGLPGLPPIPQPPSGQAPAILGAAKPPAGGLVVPDISPGRTPLGASLANPATVQRLPGMGVPVGPKIPSLSGLTSPTPLPPPTK